MRFLIIGLLVGLSAIAMAETFTPTAFYRYTPKAAVAKHPVSSNARQIGITATVATFFNYTGTTGTGGTTARYPLAANTHYTFGATPGRNIVFPNISGIVYVTEQK